MKGKLLKVSLWYTLASTVLVISNFSSFLGFNWGIEYCSTPRDKKFDNVSQCHCKRSPEIPSFN